MEGRREGENMNRQRALQAEMILYSTAMTTYQSKKLTAKSKY